MAGQLLREIPEGIRSGYNGTGSTIAAHLAVMADSTNQYVKLPTATTDPLLGVTMAAIEDATWGSIATRGLVMVTCSAAITTGARVMADNAGKALTWAAVGGTNANVLGIARTATTGANQLVEVELAGPGVISQG